MSPRRIHEMCSEREKGTHFRNFVIVCVCVYIYIYIGSAISDVSSKNTRDVFREIERHTVQEF
jgi:hypothetical protein